MLRGVTAPEEVAAKKKAALGLAVDDSAPQRGAGE